MKPIFYYTGRLLCSMCAEGLLLQSYCSVCAAFMVRSTQEFDMNQYIDRVATSVAACFIIQIELLLSIFFTKNQYV